MSETQTQDAQGGRQAVRRIGLVASHAMDKTIIVRVERRVMHPVYKKYVKRFTRLYAHDEKNEAKTGDMVELVATRPISRLKRWRLMRVLRAAEVSATVEIATEKTP
jgi:small subunit ribosomal protein S17